MWSIEYEDGKKASVKIQKVGMLVTITVLLCNFDNCKTISTAYLSVSDDQKYTTANGWFRALPFYRSNVMVFIKLGAEKDLKSIYQTKDSTAVEGRGLAAISPRKNDFITKVIHKIFTNAKVVKGN